MMRQIEEMQRQIDVLKSQLQQVQKQQAQQPAPATPAAMARSPTSGPVAKPGHDLTWQVGGGEVKNYGYVDVLLDNHNIGMSGFLNGGQPVTGKNGWVPDISSNLSYFGVRGSRRLDEDLTALFQFETEVAYAATPGASDQAPDGTAQKTGLGSRNSFIGMRSKTFGSIKAGKTDAP